MLSVAVVVAVIFVFLRSVPATFIASVAVPLSLVGTFGAMYLLHFSLNNLTLMALTIATGFVVDDAIVMIENISRYIEAGETPMQAALKGARQIGFTIISLTVSLIAVLIPLLFMGDVVGRLFRQFAITLAVTILISAVVSLTLVPTLSARWLRNHDKVEDSGFGRRSKAVIDGVVERYDRRSDLGAGPPSGDAGRRGGHSDRHGDPVHDHPQRPVSDPGHRPDPGRDRGQSVDLLRRHGRGAAEAGRAAAARSRMSPA